MRKTFRRVATAVAFLLACPHAEAAYGVNDALETIGISAGIGAVMGLSTIAFYESPTSHMKNALVGAGAGLIVGLGVAAYLAATAPESDEIDPEELLQKKKLDVPGKVPGKDPTKSEKKSQRLPLRPSSVLLASVPATAVLRGATERWTIALPVLELRF